MNSFSSLSLLNALSGEIWVSGSLSRNFEQEVNRMTEENMMNNFCIVDFLTILETNIQATGIILHKRIIPCVGIAPVPVRVGRHLLGIDIF